MRAVPGIIAVALVVAACGRADLGPVQQTGDYKLYTATSTQTSQQVSVIDTRSHVVERSLPFGTPSPNWTHLYSVEGRALVDVNPQTGAARHTLSLPGPFQLPIATIGGLPGGLSQDGRWLVLVYFDDSGSGLPSGSHLLLVDTSYKGAPKRFDLGGDFQFDAVSNDGQRIYLIEYQSSSSYRVRLFNVSGGRLDPGIIVDKSDGNAAMAGLRLSGVPSPDGQWLYSVYIREHLGAFIHALNLEGSIAICLDLPGAGYASSESGFHWSLAMSSDGKHLYAANGVMGVVAAFDISGGFPGLTKVGHLATPAPSASLIQNVQAKGFGSNGTVLSPDGRALVTIATNGVEWIDTATYRTTATRLSDWRVWSVALSPDGETLYAVSDGGMIAEISMTGAHAVTTFAGGPGQPMAVIRVEAVQAP
jgi:hypothetical protein